MAKLLSKKAKKAKKAKRLALTKVEVLMAAIKDIRSADLSDFPGDVDQALTTIENAFNGLDQRPLRGQVRPGGVADDR